MYIFSVSLTPALVGGWVANATLRPLYSREKLGTHCAGGWVGPRADLQGCGKSRLPPGFDPRNIRPVASRRTDCLDVVHFI